MAGKSGIYRFLILVVAAFAVAACSAPMGEGMGGSIGGGGPSLGAYDALQVEYRQVYKVGESFQRADFQLYTIFQGERKPVPDYEYEVYIIEDPDRPDMLSPPVLSSYPFETEGKKIILVRYDGLPLQCPIEVLPAGSAGNQTSGIQIIWVE